MTSNASDPMNLARACLEGWATDAASAGRPAFSFARPDGDDETWTYAETWERVQRVAYGLLARGLEPGDRVLVRLPHSPDYAFAFFGATLAGLVPIPASPLLTAEEAEFLLDDADARAVIIEPGSGVDGFTGVEVTTEGLYDPPTDAPPLPETDAEDAAFLIYTSGTTSRQKGVLHAHRSLRGRAFLLDGWEGFRPDDVTLHGGMLNWTYTLGVGLMDAWAAGAHAMLYAGPNEPQRWPGLFERLGVTVFMAVPTVYRQLLKYARPEDHDLSRLRHVLCAGEPLAPSLREEWLDRVGVEMYEALGMTEISTYISSGPVTPVKVGSPGRAQPGRRVAILPEEGDSTEPLPAGEVGLLAVHRSDPGLMLGYWRRPEEEEQVYRGEWFVGGDLAAMDDDEYIWFHGRADDVFKSFGYRLSPVEIESAVESFPGVSEAAVVGQAVDEQKTLITACIVPAEGSEFDEQALSAYVAEHLAGYKRPHQYVVVDGLPRTRNGKVQRRALIERLAGRQG